MRYVAQHIKSAGLAFGALVITGGAALAQAALTDITPCPEPIAAIATCYTAGHETGAYLLAFMPKNWNGNLIVFAHGGPTYTPPSATSRPRGVNNMGSLAVRRGFAWIGSTFRREGYGVRMAAEDSDDARKFFIAHFATPRRTVLLGASYGGLIGAKLVETYAKSPDGGSNFDGALLIGGDVAGVTAEWQQSVHARVIYQYYCNNLPHPTEPQYPLWSGLPADSGITKEDIDARVDECTGVAKAPDARSELQKRNLATILNVLDIPEGGLLGKVENSAFDLRDIARRTTGGRNPFSNNGVRYGGSADDAALNRGVARFTADPAAAAALKADGDLTGVLPVPVVSIHSINDPVVEVEVESAYRDLVKTAGSGERLVQAFTDEHAHVGQSAPEVTAALDALMQWIETGAKPTPQSITAAFEELRASLNGPCRYHPEFTPKPLNTRFYPREITVR
jgi:pimeloyl-ACP methyl ester carboxylesterase